jgi:8-oxo-dGTP pyrophosphatase MutT (NUDIX family)
MNTYIKYDQIKTVKENEYSTNYRFLCQDELCRRGIIKGDVDKDETSLNAIKREIKEETGIVVKRDPVLLGDLRTRKFRVDVYSYEISTEELEGVQEILDHYKETDSYKDDIDKDRNYGELYYISFENLINIINVENRDFYGVLTIDIVTRFYSSLEPFKKKSQKTPS